MLVLICGSRTWDDRATMFRKMVDLTKEHGAANLNLLHGGARGADRMSGEIAKALGWNTVVVENADWELYGKRAGYVRNKKMLTYKPDLVFAFKSHADSIGTNMMIDLATQAEIPVTVYDYSPEVNDETKDTVDA